MESVTERMWGAQGGIESCMGRVEAREWWLGVRDSTGVKWKRGGWGKWGAGTAVSVNRFSFTSVKSFGSLPPTFGDASPQTRLWRWRICLDRL